MTNAPRGQAPKGPAIPDGRCVWTAATWKPHPGTEGAGGPCADLVVQCRNALDESHPPSRGVENESCCG